MLLEEVENWEHVENEMIAPIDMKLLIIHVKKEGKAK
jgi:hypothetical protein